ncbi:DUF559 domain-containing protein [Leifsonia sp. NPDC077715]|uniref:endonuclease domain-containing protein n=1 Tax=Leifsonia sp. NPDC077715 TaxID=3155539 RepID=UPI0034436EC6
MRTAQPLPPALQLSAFSVAAARRQGVPLQRLRRTDLASPFHGTRLPAEVVPDVHLRCEAYRTVMVRGAFFSHATAAALYGLPLPTRFRDAAIDLGCVLPARAPKGRGVKGHALAIGPALTAIDGLPVPEPAEVWCQLAAVLTVDELVIAGDALVRRTHALCELQTLQDAVDAAGFRPGVRKLRQAIELVRARTDSPMESILRLAIIRAGLMEPAVNYAIADATGRIRASGDLVFPAARVVVEYDGDHHRFDRRQWHTDIDRLFVIESLGWRVVRINSAHMADGAREALARIRSALRTSGPNTPLSDGR